MSIDLSSSQFHYLDHRPALRSDDCPRHPGFYLQTYLPLVCAWMWMHRSDHPVSDRFACVENSLAVHI